MWEGALTFVQLVLLLQAVGVQEDAAVAVQFFALTRRCQFVGASFGQQLLLLAGAIAREKREGQCDLHGKKKKKKIGVEQQTFHGHDVENCYQYLP